MLFKKLKLLFITKDWSSGIERNNFFLSQSLSKLTKLTIWESSGNIHDILTSLDFTPDFILLNDLRPSRCPDITGLNTCDIPVGMIMHDLQYKTDYRRQFIEENNILHLFIHYRDRFIEYFPEYEDRMIWFPHFVQTDVFKDYKLKKDIDFLLMGSTYPPIYPLRATILDGLKKLPNFIFHEHPGYGRGRYDEESYYVGTRYAKEINRAKIFFTCDSIYKYPVMKYYEVLACNTLLLASHSKELEDLGFIPGIHFVEVNEENYYEKAMYYLENYESIGKTIAKNGYKMVRKHHSVKARAKFLVKKIKEIINTGK
ncbi:glycosyltransferase [Bacillus tianshenii]|uniref:glycosyltransferase family protein n=1 Tax=Sutcliffiella tianshenii TaxID=1463404 RepID=UPI001CD5ED6B|nr:glycosyltransferase [Bacillus tianshenii]MCA1320830.1 glycosyltransferase [Bacillus tianshenii]